MGAKEETSSRQTRNQLKCTTCGQLFRTTEALNSHTARSHSSTVLKATASTNMKTTTVSKADVAKIIQQAEKPKRLIRVGENTVTLTPNGSVQVKKPPVKAPQDEEASDFSFQCPKCVNKYPSYITAYRHIQSCHCVNRAGAPVKADSPHLIKPIKSKVCSICKQEYLWNVAHECKDSKASAAQKKTAETAQLAAPPVAGYLCSSCNNDFEDLRQFDLHTPHSHNLVQSFFFSNYREFTKWKAEMEEETKTNYQMKAKYEEMKHFRCTAFSTSVRHKKKNMLLFCPSAIILQEYMTGLQVHFYKTHARHECKPYLMPKLYKKHLITNFLRTKEDPEVIPSVNADLYVQFKTVMESIIIEAAKLDKAHLRMLHGKALGMTSILNNYIDHADSDDDFPHNAVINKIPTDLPDTEMKEEPVKDVEVKRDVSNVVGKKIVKLVNPDDEIQRIEDVRSSRRLKRRGDDTTPVQKVLPTKRSKKSATITGAKRDSTPEQESCVVTTNATIEAAPEVGNDDKKPETKKDTPKPKSAKKLADIEKAIDEMKSSDTSPSTKKVQEWFPKSPSFSFADQYKDFVKKNFSQTTTEKTIKKKKKLRTKLGQFNPSLSPKTRSKSTDSPSSTKSSSFCSELNSPAPKAKPSSISSDLNSPATKAKSGSISGKSKTSTKAKLGSISSDLHSPATTAGKLNTPVTKAKSGSISGKLDTPVTKPKSACISGKLDTPVAKVKSGSISGKLDTPVTKPKSGSLSGKLYKSVTKARSGSISGKLNTSITKAKSGSISGKSNAVATRAKSHSIRSDLNSPTTKPKLGNITNKSNKRATKVKSSSIDSESSSSVTEAKLSDTCSESSSTFTKAKSSSIYSEANSPVAKAKKIEIYEVKEQENDCNILILKI